eukprot:scaffold35285_cov69-Phaeocystis_antarctica.AAC.2
MNSSLGVESRRMRASVRATQPHTPASQWALHGSAALSAARSLESRPPQEAKSNSVLRRLVYDDLDCEDRRVAPERADRTSQDVELVPLSIPVCEPKPLVPPLRREEMVHGPHVKLLASVVVLDDIEHSNAVTGALSYRAFARGARCDRDLLASVPTLGCRNVQCLLGSAKPAQEWPDIGVAAAELLQGGNVVLQWVESVNGASRHHRSK